MSKKQSSNTQPRTLLGGIATLILVVVLAVVSQVTGIDFLSMLQDSAPAPTAVAQQVPNTDGGPVVENVDLAAPIASFFTAPTGSRDSSTYVNGLDTIVAAAIMEAQQTIDVAAFELNSQAIADALLDRHNNGVQVRIVTDDDHGLDVSLYEAYLAADDDAKEDILLDMEEDPEDTLLDELYNAGIPIVDDDRSALMHNKFIIIDGLDLWTGSMNMTVNGSYRNNNNFNHFRSTRLVEDYQTEFNEMFVDGEFGPRSPANTPNPQVTINGVEVEVYFAPEDEVIPQIVAEVTAAQESVRFMAFSFTENDLGDPLLAYVQDSGITLEGVFERTGSMTEFSEMTKFFCAGYDVRQDGNNFILHHKVIIIDDSTVIIGSFNFSGNATSSNDENLVIIHDPAITAQYIAEYNARFAEANPPEGIDCGS